MHPQTFLNTFWRMELLPQVFVAMSFAPQYQSRFEQVIEPSIREVSVGDVNLRPHRVDISKSGDSILTEIMEGVAHSQLVLADVSSIGKDSKTGEAYRNGNVLYEVGLALACRLPHEVLLIRDDRDKFLFDVSTVPHINIDFTEIEKARETIKTELLARLKEQNYVNDARVQMALNSLCNQEIKLLDELLEYPPNRVSGWEISGTIFSVLEAAIMRLLDKRLIKLKGRFETGPPAYELTPLGRTVAIIVKSRLPKYKLRSLSTSLRHPRDAFTVQSSG